MRPVNLIVLHCSATRDNQPYTAEQLDADHRARGFACAGYHYYVLRSGEVIEMRPLGMVPAHVTGYNRHSIGICYEGGLNTQGKVADTRTAKQKAAILSILKQLATRFPQCRICGHCDLAAKSCPCFDASKEYGHLGCQLKIES